MVRYPFAVRLDLGCQTSEDNEIVKQIANAKESPVAVVNQSVKRLLSKAERKT